MKTPYITATASFLALALSSCGINDPDYKEWKKQKKAEAAAAANPYGAPTAGANPYGTPNLSGDPSTASTPATSATSGTPYQPLPGIPNAPLSTPSAQAPAENNVAGSNMANTTPSMGSTSHTVVSGDSLWQLSRTYNTSIESIQAANGITGTTIRTGQTLMIPTR